VSVVSISIVTVTAMPYAEVSADTLPNPMTAHTTATINAQFRRGR
jgi:hypothetical protein